MNTVKSMYYNEIKPCTDLTPFIHSFWELKGEEHDKQWERNFPDGCAGLVFNLGDTCITNNGSDSVEFGKTYVVGVTTSFKDSFINNNSHLFGVCLKPASFSNFYDYFPQNELTDQIFELKKTHSFNIDNIIKAPFDYLNLFFKDRIRVKNCQFQKVLQDIHNSKGQLCIHGLAKRNFMTIRQLERNFKTLIGIAPKEYSNIVRFQNALSMIKNSGHKRSLLDIAFEGGFYDHAHLTNEIKKNTGFAPSQL